MTQCVYLAHTITNGNLVLSSVAQKPLVHIWSPWQMAVPSGKTAVIFGQQERKFVSRATTPVMNHRHPWMKSIAPRPAPYQVRVSLCVNRPHWHLPVHHSWEVQLQDPHSADLQGLSSPLTDWTYKLNKTYCYFVVVVTVTISPSEGGGCHSLHVVFLHAHMCISVMHVARSLVSWHWVVSWHYLNIITSIATDSWDPKYNKGWKMLKTVISHLQIISDVHTDLDCKY